MIGTLLEKQYGFEVRRIQKLGVGAGSNTYFISADTGEYILKNPADSEINNPEGEPRLCAFLRDSGIPASEFLPNRSGDCVWREGERLYHLQKFVEGRCYELHTAPDWLTTQSAQMLGRIHAVLRGYEPLPVGIGEVFIQRMTPESALRSYENTLNRALAVGDASIADDLLFRISLLERGSLPPLRVEDFTCCNTHGDYFISQLLCGDRCIRAVVDWTSACVHPAVWEIFRSFVFGVPDCRDGEVDAAGLLAYIDEYLKYAPLTDYDIRMMPYLYYYQIAVCDYYGQYYRSAADNRTIYLQQAQFATRLLKWLDKNAQALSAALS